MAKAEHEAEGNKEAAVEKQDKAADESPPQRFTCSSCQAKEATVWRLTRDEAKEIICNKCYAKKYQPVCAGLPQDSSDEDGAQANGSAEINGHAEDKDTTKRKTVSEAELEGEANEVKEEPADDEPVKKKVKKEKKKDKKDKEEKAEAKDEDDEDMKVKDELKTEKEEEDDMVDANAVVYPESDTEYGEVDVAQFPEMLRVQDSTNKRVDGDYARLPKASRGHPCYRRYSHEAKITYFYWRQKKWMFSANALGSRKYLACVEELDGVFPVEPYPFVWQVVDKSQKEDRDEETDKPAKKDKPIYTMSLGCRVIDGAVVEDIPQPEEQATISEGSGAIARLKRDRRAKKDKRDKKDVDDTKDEADASDEKKNELNSARETQASASSTEKVLAADSQTKMGEDEESEEKEESSSSDDAQSDSDSDSSSSDAKADPPVEVSTSRSTNEKRPPAPTIESLTSRIYLELGKLTDAEARDKKLRQFKGVIEKQLGGNAKQVALDGIPPDKLRALLEKLEMDFGAKPKAAPQPATASAQNRHLHDKDMSAVEEQKVVPVHGQPNHRIVVAKKCCLRPSRGPRRNPCPVDRTDERVEVQIISHRGMGDELWYSMPGAVVLCDQCGTGVPQAHGALQGDPTRSQFAQFQFMCGNCLAQNDVGFDLNYT